MILLAVIVGAHGIRGAVKVKTFTQNPANLVAYGTLSDDRGQAYSLKLTRVVSTDSLIVSIKGINDRNQAEALKGTKLYVERAQLPEPLDEEFYYSDLIGLRVMDLDSQEIGRVYAVHNYGAGDYLEIIDSEWNVYTIMFTGQAVPHIQLPADGKEGMITIDRQYLFDTSPTQAEGEAPEETSEKE